MREKVNFFRHASILALTIIIFTIGIFIGNNVEQMRVNQLYTDLQQQDLDYQNVVTESNYISYLVGLKEQGGKIDCNVIKGNYYTSIINLDDSRLRLEAYINNAKVKEEEYARLKDHYANLQINYWILANRINNLCEGNMNPVLYFYDEKKKCPGCEDQGTHLSYVKAKLQDDVLIFSLDAQKMGTTKLLVQRYGVFEREMPVIVINEKVYGYSTNEEIFSILCKNGLDNKEVCQN